MNHAVVLAGGIGSRLYPESRPDKPKQFLCFDGTQTLIEATVERIAPLIPPENLWLLTAAAMEERIRELLSKRYPAVHILAEPVRKNTAPSIGWAAEKILQCDEDATMFVCPSDHVIRPAETFRQALTAAANFVQQSPKMLAAFGIKPTFPATGYGYIQTGGELKIESRELCSFEIQTDTSTIRSPFSTLNFHEKPALEKAEEFLEAGGYYWNSGIYVWKAKTILDQIRRYEPEIGKVLDELRRSPSEPAAVARYFAAVKSISIDYAVLERAEHIAVFEAPFEWNDVGTWRALDLLYAHQRDSDSNLAVNAQLRTLDAHNCTVRSSGAPHTFMLAGVDDIVAVHTEDVTLIAKKEYAEQIREL